ncbi:hypothetical protein J2X43_003595 [Rhizobium sp. BE258]|jgi:hypothetical protein|nr:hypothetical protein [Rhizobium sp. BE258]
MPPRSWVERVSTVVRWGDHAEGGHFPEMKRPVELAEDTEPHFADWVEVRKDLPREVD